MNKSKPLYKQIKDSFIKEIEMGKLKAGDRIPSESEIMKAFHVSQITAKNALNSLAELGYVSRIKGKGTFVNFTEENKREYTIGIIFTTLKTYIDKDLLNYIEYFAQKEKIRFFFGLSREVMEDEIKLINHFIDCGVEGLIIFPTESEIYNETILKLNLQRFPLVLIDRYFNKLGIPCVTSDNFSGGYKLADLTIKKGFKRLSFVTTAQENSATIDRMQGIEAAFVAHETPINKNLWLTVPSDCTQPDELIRFFEDSKPDSIITVNAHLSSLISEYTTSHKVYHLSFDNPAGCNYFVKQDTQKIAQQAIKLLKHIMIEQEHLHSFISVPVEVSAGQLEA